VSKFLNIERELVKNIVANLTIKRIPEAEIIKAIFDQTNKTITDRYLRTIRQQIKKESYHWYKTMREGEYEYIHSFKERINEIMDLQKKCHAILDNPATSQQIQLSAIAELHRLTITLSQLYDIAPTIIGTGANASISIASETKASPSTTHIIV
jgi:hypothetical protein